VLFREAAERLPLGQIERAYLPGARVLSALGCLSRRWRPSQTSPSTWTLSG